MNFGTRGIVRAVPMNGHRVANMSHGRSDGKGLDPRNHDFEPGTATELAAETIQPSVIGDERQRLTPETQVPTRIEWAVTIDAFNFVYRMVVALTPVEQAIDIWVSRQRDCIIDHLLAAADIPETGDFDRTGGVEFLHPDQGPRPAHETKPGVAHECFSLNLLHRLKRD